MGDLIDMQKFRESRKEKEKSNSSSLKNKILGIESNSQISPIDFLKSNPIYIRQKKQGRILCSNVMKKEIFEEIDRFQKKGFTDLYVEKTAIFADTQGTYVIEGYYSIYGKVPEKETKSSSVL